MKRAWMIQHIETQKFVGVAEKDFVILKDKKKCLRFYDQSSAVRFFQFMFKLYAARPEHFRVVEVD